MYLVRADATHESRPRLASSRDDEIMSPKMRRTRTTSIGRNRGPRPLEAASGLRKSERPLEKRAAPGRASGIWKNERNRSEGAKECSHEWSEAALAASATRGTRYPDNRPVRGGGISLLCPSRAVSYPALTTGCASIGCAVAASPVATVLRPAGASAIRARGEEGAVFVSSVFTCS